MIRVSAGWWAPVVRIAAGSRRWIARPEPGPSRPWDRFLHPPWNRRWIVRTDDSLGTVVGSVTKGPLPAVEFSLQLRDAVVEVPRPTEGSVEFVSDGRIIRWAHGEVSRDGSSVGGYSYGWKTVAISGYPLELEELLAVLGVGFCLRVAYSIGPVA